MTLAGEATRRIMAETQSRGAAQKKHVKTALVLSFLLAGLGDLYSGSWIKAVIFFALDLLCLLLIFAMGLGVFLYVFVWVCGLMSAWISSSTSNKMFMRRIDDVLSQNV
jgi:hypothetical protein